MINVKNESGDSESNIDDFKSSSSNESPKRYPRTGTLTNSVPSPYETASDQAEPKVKSSRVQWSKVGPTSYASAGETIKTMPVGVYTIKMVNGEPVFDKNETNVDELLDFPDSKTDKILTEIDEFWEKHELFKKHGFLHRRGYLLYGPPGGGKTSLVQQVIKKIIEKRGIVFICGCPSITSMGLKAFREVEPNRNAVCIFEDIDAIIDRYGEDDLLSMLDGENQIDKVVNIATTNYPEKLDKRLVNRPRRFDRVIKIGTPNETVRRMYFKDKLKIDDIELENWVKSTDGFSFATMAELVISVKCLNNPFEKSVETLRKLMSSKPNSSQTGDENDEQGRMGFFPSGTKR